MHETGTVRSLIREVELIASQYGESNVLSVQVRLGALSPFSEEHLREHFVQEAEGTMLEDATLVVELGTKISDPLAQDLILLSIQCGETSSDELASRT